MSLNFKMYGTVVYFKFYKTSLNENQILKKIALNNLKGVSQLSNLKS